MQRFVSFILLNSFLVPLLLGCNSFGKNGEGMRYYGQARYAEALAAFQQAQSTSPNNADVYYNIAATYHQTGRISLQQGQTAAAQQQYDLAIQNYKQCLTKNPNHCDAYRGLASLYVECQNPEAAFQTLIGWQSANPVSAEPKIELARLYQEFAQIYLIQQRTDFARVCQDTAMKLLQAVLVSEPTNYRALRALGYLKEMTGDTAGAMADYQRSLQANPQQKDLKERLQ
jgi:tetratricopeptide (TPR) repeat protein